MKQLLRDPLNNVWEVVEENAWQHGKRMVHLAVDRHGFIVPFMEFFDSTIYDVKEEPLKIGMEKIYAVPAGLIEGTLMPMRKK